ncbi:hypothetical protein ACIBQX_50570 [Nonomuraea sp. NPDC049714]|uniref:hypothetical protein n=1 Tax=Nonomuraea sp. NPDC049714 TaxID=3364357 RepID=UPI00378F827C
MSCTWVIYVRALLWERLDRARVAPARGSSAVEWVIITAIIGGVALGLVTLIKALVAQRMGAIQGDW